ncbi:uncharacterized protein LOC113305650 [Papaver somniferum]|uniref:uncharacterized protein LOC113305650 n=1 Tax=Papaver somniferum TaxID=3469 RepID=UPI000E701359|nr:uncharacterized protein LOC113305650 [Papaver somniferum]
MNMSKSFDRLEWSFLLDMLDKFGFSQKFCQLISQCITTTQIDIQFNGSPCKPFISSRGIRQGDPFSPYLFIIAMDPFSRYLAHCEASKQLTGMKISKSAPKINHLLFADDCFLFCKSNLTRVKKLLQDISGIMEVRELNIKEEKYLGLHFFVGQNKRIPFSVLAEKMDHRLSRWNGSNMSEAARTVTVKHVTSEIPIHHMTSFKLPDTTIKKMKSTQQAFWRNKKTCKGRHVTTWKRVQKPKEEGGLGLRDLSIFNRALLAKSAWKLCADNESVMTMSLQAKYFPDGECCWNVGDGQKIQIWKHRWIPSISSPPQPKQNCNSDHLFQYVHQLFSTDSPSWNMIVLDELFDQHTIDEILKISLHSLQEDKLIWLLERNGKFSDKLNPTVTGDVDSCPFCNMHIETSSHVIVNCTLSRAVWFSTLVWNSSNVNTLEDWKIVRISNLFIEEHVKQKYSIQVKLPKVNRKNIHWSPPPVNMLTINCDGSYCYNDNSSGIGLIICNCAGNNKAAMSITMENVSSAVQAESTTLWEAVKWAIDLKMEKVLFELDCKVVVDVVNKEDFSIDWRCVNLIKDIKLFFKNNRFWKCSYVQKSM